MSYLKQLGQKVFNNGPIIFWTVVAKLKIQDSAAAEYPVNYNLFSEHWEESPLQLHLQAKQLSVVWVLRLLTLVRAVNGILLPKYGNTVKEK